MHISTICYSCRSSTRATVGQIVECQCSAAFVLIPGFPSLSAHSGCYRLKDALFLLSFSPILPPDINDILETNGVSFLNSPALYPMFVNLSKGDPEKARLCRWDCSWGANYYHVEVAPTPTTLTGYLIFPLEKLPAGTVVYHGTTEGCAAEIFSSNSLLPPQVTGNKTHGLNSEEDLRYAGIDRSSAEAHDKGALIELDFRGWIAKSHLGLPPKVLLHLLNAMPRDVCAIEFWEDGRALAFRSDAKVVPASTLNNESLKAIHIKQIKSGLIEKLIRWFS